MTDPTGASISGAAVSAVRLETDQKQTTVTNGDGNYNLPFLPVGHYTLSASAPGFQSVDVGNFELVVGQTARMDVRMKIGQISEKVTVEASAIGLQTENATVG
ncbi:MAG: carboxypeptidase-like regulatory domain-containing protein, partial [Bryobacteraceae bacterium]